MAPHAQQTLQALLLTACFLGYCRTVTAAEGCYDVISTHRCDCTVTKEVCEDRNHIWSDRCTSCERPECTKELSWGCFNSDSHGCECEVSEHTCEQAQGKSWTHECWSCCHHSEWGCNVHAGQPDAGCHCDVTESECMSEFSDATWTHECHVCADEEDTPAGGDGKEDDNTVTIVVVSVVAAVIVIAIIAAVFVLKMRKKRPAPPAGSGAVVVGSPVNETSGSNSKS